MRNPQNFPFSSVGEQIQNVKVSQQHCNWGKWALHGAIRCIYLYLVRHLLHNKIIIVHHHICATFSTLHHYVQNSSCSTGWNMRIALHKKFKVVKISRFSFYKYKTYMVAQQPDVTGFTSQHVFLLLFFLSGKKANIKASITCVTCWLKKHKQTKKQQRQSPWIWWHL